jgi:serine/threonine protein phosphatase PrpC
VALAPSQHALSPSPVTPSPADARNGRVVQPAVSDHPGHRHGGNCRARLFASPLQAEDMLLLASDGLTRYLKPAEIASIASADLELQVI